MPNDTDAANIRLGSSNDNPAIIDPNNAVIPTMTNIPCQAFSRYLVPNAITVNMPIRIPIDTDAANTPLGSHNDNIAIHPVKTTIVAIIIAIALLLSSRCFVM